MNHLAPLYRSPVRYRRPSEPLSERFSWAVVALVSLAAWGALVELIAWHFSLNQ